MQMVSWGGHFFYSKITEFYSKIFYSESTIKNCCVGDLLEVKLCLSAALKSTAWEILSLRTHSRTDFPSLPVFKFCTKPVVLGILSINVMFSLY